MRSFILSEGLKEAIADQVTVAANGGDARDAYARIVGVVETANVIATLGGETVARDNPEHVKLLRAVMEHIAPICAEFDKQLPLWKPDMPPHPVIAAVAKAIGWRES